LLRQHGYRALTAATGHEALELVTHTRFNLRTCLKTNLVVIR
jgi:CheY-like chemotaxis protein